MSCLVRDCSDALIEPDGPGNSGPTANTAGCALPGSGLPVLPVAPRPTLHFRNGVSEHVLPQTALTLSLSQRVPATQSKKPPCNNTWWTGIKRTVQSPPLCLHRECRLRHSPTVVAGSSLDCCCTGNKGTASGIERRGADRATKGGKASGRSDRHCHLPSTPEGPVALEKSKVILAMYSKKTNTQPQPAWNCVPRHTADEYGNTWTQALLARDELDGWPDLRP